MNSQLYDKKYKVPEPIINRLNTLIYNSDVNSDGVKRAKFLVKNGYCTYQMLKGLKSFFDHYNIEKNTPEQYELSGGDQMKIWTETILGRERKRTDISAKNRQGLDAKTTTGTHTLGAQNGSVNIGTKLTEAFESEDNPIMDDTQTDAVKENAIAVIYNNEGEILLLKRSTNNDWCPDKWGLVGGGVDSGEEPEEAIKREVWEETGLKLDNFNRSFGVDLPDSKLHVYTAYYSGNLYHDVTINDEHSSYSLYTIPEMEYIDTTPNLILYVSNALTMINK